MSSRTATFAVVGSLLLGLLLLAAALPLPYVLLTPGPVYDVFATVDGKPIITVQGHRTYPTDGSLNAVTVYELGPPGSRINIVDAVRGWLSKSSAVVPSRLFYPQSTSAQDAKQQSTIELDDSEEVAVAAAMRYLNIPVTRSVVVLAVTTGTPADGKLQPGDQILEIDHVAVTGALQARELITKRKPGDDVTLTISRAGVRSDVTVQTVAAPDDPTRPLIGFLPGYSYTPPFPVSVNLGNGVGGPSAGLIFSLGIVDRLTPGALTSGHTVAGTGTISLKGRVGPIGGIQQKLAAARAAGATVFLAPASNCGDVVGAVPDGLQVVKVKTLDEAVSDLKLLAAGNGATLPTCTPS